MRDLVDSRIGSQAGMRSSAEYSIGAEAADTIHSHILESCS
jgi:hypothetical protein